MPRARLCVGQQAVKDRPRRRQFVGDAEIGFVVLVEGAPARFALPGNVEAAAAMVLDQIIFPRPRVVMIDLGQLPGHRSGLGLQKIRPRLVAEIARQNRPGPVHVTEFGEPRRVRIARLVRQQFAMIGVEPREQCLERQVDRIVTLRRPGEALGDKAGPPLSMSGTPEDAPVDQKGGGGGDGVDQFGHRAVPDMDVEEFVGVEHHRPIGRMHDRQPFRPRIGGELRLFSGVDFIG
jgi:hypothetical protein